MRRRVLATGLAAVALTAGLSACGIGGASGSGTDSDTILVGASPTPHAEILNYVAKNLAPKQHLTVKVKVFNDYVQPNVALQDGSLDANYFQHKPYLDEYTKAHGGDFVSVAAVHIEPLGLYSKKVTKLADLKSGATIAIPNDPSNGGRALKLLADQGLLKLKSRAGVTATEKDIVANPKKLTFKPLEAAQTARALDDVDASVVNGNYALAVKLDPAKDALALESAKNNPYANLLVVKKGHENDAKVKKLAALLTSPEVKKYIEDKYHGSVLAAE